MHKDTVFLALITLPSLITAEIPSLEKLSLDQKIGQLFMVATVSNKARNAYFMQCSPYQLDPHYAQEMIKTHHIGGIIFMGTSTPEEQIALTNQLQEQSMIPLFVAQDAEWGLAMRHQEDIITYPHAMTLGAIDPSNDYLIYKLGMEIGKQCKAIRLNINFAPVADVNSEPTNPIIGTRSFGEDPNRVAKKVALFMRGMQQAGIIACAKHFPGHGDTKTDSHHTMPVVLHSKEHLMQVELLPFCNAITNGINAIMTAHLAVPALTHDPEIPITFSRYVVNDLLRTTLGFRGLIFTDGLGMKGVTSNIEKGEPALKALQAGHDILLCPVDVPQAIDRIKQALVDGLLNEKDLDEHVERILSTKRNHSFCVPLTYDKQTLQSDEAKQLKKELYSAAITLARNDNHILPLKNKAHPIPIITNSLNDHAPFIKTLQKHSAITHYPLEAFPSTISCNELERLLEDQPIIIIALNVPHHSGMIELQAEDYDLSAYISFINRPHIIWQPVYARLSATATNNNCCL